MQVFFCDECSRRVTEGELAAGDGTHTGDLVFCRFCMGQPGVQEQLKRAAEVQAARASASGLHRSVGRRTPHHGHRRVGLEVGSERVSRRRRPKTPARTRGPTQKMARPVSPVSRVKSGSASREQPRVRLTSATLLKSAGRLAVGQTGAPPGPAASDMRAARPVLYGLLGAVIGFTVVAVATAVAGRVLARPRSREIPVRWAGRQTAAARETRFEGECTVERLAASDRLATGKAGRPLHTEAAGAPRSGGGHASLSERGEGEDSFRARAVVSLEGRLVVFFPSGGRWTVRANGSVVYRGVVPDGRRVSVGRAADWLVSGPNRIVATCEDGAAGSRPGEPPKLIIEK